MREAYRNTPTPRLCNCLIISKSSDPSERSRLLFLRSSEARLVRLARGERSLIWVPSRSSSLRLVRLARGERSPI